MPYCHRCCGSSSILDCCGARYALLTCFLPDAEFLPWPACCLKPGQPSGGGAPTRPSLPFWSRVFRQDRTRLTTPAAREEFGEQIAKRQAGCLQLRLNC